MPQTTASALEQLDERRRHVAHLQAEIQRAREGHAATAAELQAAQDAVTAYHRACGAGERQADPNAERELLADVERIKARTTRTAGGQVVDTAVASREEVLTRQVIEANTALRAFTVEHGDRIAAELVEQARAARDGLAEGLAALTAAVNQWEAVARAWAPLAEPLGINQRDIPRCPARDALEGLRDRLDARPGTEHLALPAPWTHLPHTDLPATPNIATPTGHRSNPAHRQPWDV